MFKNPFSFSGRIRRTEYGLTVLIYFATLIALKFIATDTTENQEILTIILIIIYIPVIWIKIAQSTKRCHDLGNTGWYQIIPFYGLWMIFADGENGRNEYGLNPKQIRDYDEIDEIGKYLE